MSDTYTTPCIFVWHNGVRERVQVPDPPPPIYLLNQYKCAPFVNSLKYDPMEVSTVTTEFERQTGIYDHDVFYWYEESPKKSSR